MSGFTPGPWKQDTFYEGADWLNEMIGSDGTHVVCFGHDYDDVGMFGWPKNMPSRNDFSAQIAVAAANAPLIAAAPDLYEALEGFLCRECKGQGTVEYDTGGEDWGRHGWNACSQCDGTGTEPFATNDCGAAIIARAALALARGESEGS